MGHTRQLVADTKLDRRTLLCGIPAGIALTTLLTSPVFAAFNSAEQKLLEEYANGKLPAEGDFTFDISGYAEDGHFVPVKIWSDVPIDAPNAIRRFTVLAPQNPNVEIFSANFTSMNGRAYFQTRIRLAQSQTVYALARSADGNVSMIAKDVRVLVGGCHVEPAEAN